MKEFISPPNDSGLRKDVDDVWKTEVETYDEISELSHPNIIQRIAAITRGTQRWLMFRWADGGNLRDFWSARPNVVMTADLVRNIVEQLRGIADALKKLHEYKEHLHYRHGDLKPENILQFPDRDEARIGTFKISDMGSTQHHTVATRLRERTVGRAFATTMYQPPESITRIRLASSRLYDIWSMGCVTLEFMVWLLYGYEDLKQFSASIKGRVREPSPFFVVEPDSQGTTPSRIVATVHPAVQACLNHLSKDRECSGPTALGDLLDIVQTKLLVVELPINTASTMEMPNVMGTNTDDNTQRSQPFRKHRASAGALVQALDDILRHESESYWFTGQNRDSIHLPVYAPELVSDQVSSHISAGWSRQSGSMVDRTRSSRFSSDALAALLDVLGQNQNVRAHWGSANLDYA